MSDSTLRLLPSTFGRRKCAEVSLKRAVLHPRATKMYESVAQGSRAALLGDDKCGFRCRRVSFIHTSFCPAPLGNGKARKSRLTVPRVTFGCGTVRRHRSRRARRRPMLGVQGETVLKVKVPPVRIENSLSPLYRGTDFSTLAETFQTVWGGDS